jgi:hypothetical protein
LKIPLKGITNIRYLGIFDQLLKCFRCIAGDHTQSHRGRKLSQFGNFFGGFGFSSSQSSLYDQLTNAILNGDITTAQNLIKQGSQTGQTSAIATALATASANVSNRAVSVPLLPCRCSALAAI